VSDATTVDMSLQQSCDAAMLHANVEVRLLIDKANRLERHNAKLREERDMYRDLVGCMVHPDIPDQLQAENAKLRELVHELWVSCPVHDADCDDCKHKGGRTGCELYDRMRELGVEP